MKEDRYFEFYARKKKYWFDQITGEIYQNQPSEENKRMASEEKMDFVRKHVEIPKERWENGEVLNKMSLSLSHTCNLCCSYCFADGGTYGLRNKMTIETAKDSIDYFFKYASRKVKKYNVNFIGGEPLTNLEVFYFAIDYINEKSEEVGIPVHYIITTNGTIMNEKILSYLINNDVHINFSIDGNRHIQNMNRKDSLGKGSFDLVMNTLSILKQHGYTNMSARMTVTKPGVPSLIDDINFLWDIGFYYIFIDIVKTDIVELAFDYKAIKEFQNKIFSLMDSDDYLKRMEEGKYIRNFLDMEQLVANRRIKRECAYYNANSIEFTPEGDLYKCTYTVGKKEHSFGNIYTGMIWEKYIGKFAAPDNCKNCWCRRLCGGGCEISRDELSCIYTRIMMEATLKHYVLENEL